MRNQYTPGATSCISPYAGDSANGYRSLLSLIVINIPAQKGAHHTPIE
jgi:hypothetical protein